MMRQIRFILLISKELWKSQRDQNFDQERRVRSTCFAHFQLVPKGDVGCLLALAGQYKSPTGFCHKLYEVTREPQSRAPHLLHSFTQAHCRFSKVHQKTCSLGEQRTRAPSILTLSWRIPNKPPRWKVAAEPCKDAGILGLQRRGQDLIALNFCVIKFY